MKRDKKCTIILLLLFLLTSCFIKEPINNEPIEEVEEIKNIIYLIPDGAGWGSYDLANQVKLSHNSGVIGARTETSIDAIDGRSVSGLYLNSFIVGSINTLLANPHNDSYITDSAAAGTALSSGYKTNYLYVGIDDNLIPRANILELCQLEGKATGIVTTKSWIDATPATFLAHSNSRYNQADISYQGLMNGIDVLLAYGSETGCYTKDGYLHNLSASELGYTVVNNLLELNEEIYINKATKVWSHFLEGVNNATYGKVGYDYSANHISYDYCAHDDELSLIDMAKAAHTLLSENINDEDGFFLMVESGAIDNAAEGCIARDAVAEYLAFDETFAYFVNWAMKRNDTIVIAAPDHDSGGFIVNNLENAVNSIVNNQPVNNQDVKAGKSGHTAQEVPLWLYAPDWIKEDLLTELNIPLDVNPDKVRTGLFYDGTVLNSQYTINNSDIAHAIAKIAGLQTLEMATEMLFCDASNFGYYDDNTGTFIFANGEKVERNQNYWLDSDDTRHPFEYGRGTYIIDANNSNRNSFYVPKDFLITQGYLIPEK